MKQELVIFPGQHVELRLAFVVTMQCPENLLLFFFYFTRVLLLLLYNYGFRGKQHMLHQDIAL